MKLHEKIQSLPDAPGVYLFTDARGDLLYVGKAVSLRRRVQSYFSDRDFGYDTDRLGVMIAQIADMEYLLTANELEALVLESNLIKERRPRYNIVLRDDKHYPFIRLNTADPFPALQVVRRIRQDGALYFGPYVPAGVMWNLLALIHRTFPLRTCRSIAGRTRCLEYHLGRCLAPCEGLVTPREYGEMVQEVRLLLEGKDREVIRQLEHQMRQAADQQEYERAARYRDQIDALQRAAEGQRAISTRGEDQDLFGVAQEGREAQVQLLVVRGGKLIGRERFSFDGVSAEGQGGLLAALLPQYYLGAREIPRTVLTSHPPSDRDLLAAMLSARAGHPVTLRVPERGSRARLVEMAVGNAEAVLAQNLASASARERAMGEVQAALDLPGLPRRIECTDISNISGTLAVGSLITFVDGQPRRAEYKRFRIRSVEGADDYAMLREVLRRRLAHVEWVLPDLLLIDGGRSSTPVSWRRRRRGRRSFRWPAWPRRRSWFSAPAARNRSGCRTARAASTCSSRCETRRTDLPWPTTGRCGGKRGSGRPWTGFPGSAPGESGNCFNGSGVSHGSAPRQSRTSPAWAACLRRWPRRRTGS
jgi:excinuclease ABC subunit C